jgi:hypothetical protein
MCTEARAASPTPDPAPAACGSARPAGVRTLGTAPRRSHVRAAEEGRVVRRTRDRSILLRRSASTVATIPAGPGPFAAPDDGAWPQAATARDLRDAAGDVLLRLERLDDALRSGARHPVAEFDALTCDIRALQDRIERLSRRGCDPDVLADLVAARRSVCSALVLSFGLLADLR